MYCADEYKQPSGLAAHATAADPLIENPEFAEQQNSDLAFLKAGASHMRQTTLLFFVRLYLYKLAKSKSEDIYRRDHAKRARGVERPVCARAQALSPEAAAAALSTARAVRNAGHGAPHQQAAVPAGGHDGVAAAVPQPE